MDLHKICLGVLVKNNVAQNKVPSAMDLITDTLRELGLRDYSKVNVYDPQSNTTSEFIFIKENSSVCRLQLMGPHQFDKSTLVVKNKKGFYVVPRTQTDLI